MGHSTVPLVIPYNESTAVKGQNDIQHFSQLFHTITMQILLKAWHEDRFHTSLISQNNDQTAMWKQQALSLCISYDSDPTPVKAWIINHHSFQRNMFPPQLVSNDLTPMTAYNEEPLHTVTNYSKQLPVTSYNSGLTENSHGIEWATIAHLKYLFHTIRNQLHL